MSLGVELGLGPGDFVLAGDLATPPQRGRATILLIFLRISLPNVVQINDLGLHHYVYNPLGAAFQKI